MEAEINFTENELTGKNMKMYAKGLFKKISGDISLACQKNNINGLSIHLVSAKKGDNLKPFINGGKSE